MSMGEDRNVFLGRVRAALGRQEGATVSEAPPAVDEALARLATQDDDLVAMLDEKASEVGMNVRRIQKTELAGTIGEIVAGRGAKKIGVVVSGEVDGQLGVHESIGKLDVEVVDWRQAEGMAAQFEPEVGITDVFAALAETGTLVCVTDGDHPRGMSLAPPCHVAIVRQSDILPDMIDLWPRVLSDEGAVAGSSISFITGPSKTADIEGELVTGVHGPGVVEILVVVDA